MMELNSYLLDSANLVKKRINEFIRNKPLIHPVLKKSMLYSINSGGKRIRPSLMFAVFELLSNKDKSEAVDAASAIEMVHTYSLIHDDLPAMDNDDLRRGKPTNHKVFGEGIAILAGDALLTDAFNIIASSRTIKESLKPKIIEILSFRSGSSGMVSGQVLDLLSEGNEDENKEKKNIRYIHLHKTADMIMASCEIGVVLSEKTEYYKEIKEFAKNIGIAFQIVDDVLDVIGDKKKLGKRGSDEKNKKLTYVKIYGIEKSREIANRLVNSALKKLDLINADEKKKNLLKEMAYLIVRREK